MTGQDTAKDGARTRIEHMQAELERLRAENWTLKTTTTVDLELTIRTLEETLERTQRLLEVLKAEPMSI